MNISSPPLSLGLYSVHLDCKHLAVWDALCCSHSTHGMLILGCRLREEVLSGVSSRELCDKDGRIRGRSLAPQDQHPFLCTPGLHWTAAFPGSAFISSLGASSIVALQMAC